MDALLQKYLVQWNLSDPQIITKTSTSTLHKVQKNNTPYVLKIYSKTGRIYESIGPAFLENCHGNGVIDVLEYNGEACLLEYIDGEELISLVHSDKDEEATLIIAQTLNKIHSHPIPEKHDFNSLETHMQTIFSHEKKDAPDIIKRIAIFARHMLNNQQEIRLLHGDMHHKNVMHHSQKGWLALDPQATIGDRAYDCANTLHNPAKRQNLTKNEDRLLKQAEILGSNMNIDPQRIINYAYIHGALSSCWTKDGGDDYCQASLNRSAVLEPYISKI